MKPAATAEDRRPSHNLLMKLKTSTVRPNVQSLPPDPIHSSFEAPFFYLHGTIGDGADGLFHVLAGNEPEDTAMSWKLPGLRGRRASEHSEAASTQATEPLPAVPPDDSCLGRQSISSDASR